MIKTRKLFSSFGYALDGIYLAVKLDQNVRFHLITSVFVLILSFFLKISTVEFLFIVLAIFFVLISEMVNTAIEEMTNLIIEEHHVSARIAKDIAAGAVLLSAVFAVIVASIILFPKLYFLLF